MTFELETLIAKRFIARSDVKAIQGPGGQYRPVRTTTRGPDGQEAHEYHKFTLADLSDHLAGRATYGHYLVNQGQVAKCFVLDVDLRAEGFWVEHPDLSTTFTEQQWNDGTVRHPCNPREAWRDRAHPGRGWMKLQLRSIAEMLSMRIRDELGIDVVCAYSGNKGVHVYGLTGPILAAEAREAAQLVLASFPEVFVVEGNHYRALDSHWGSFSNFTVEVFPKQGTVAPGHFGNLVRLPLGVNQKNPQDPTFFLDQSRAHTELAPHPDPVALLTGDGKWKD